MLQIHVQHSLQPPSNAPSPPTTGLRHVLHPESASSVLRTCAWPDELRRACQPVSSFSQCVWMFLTLQCELVQGELLLLFPSPVFYAPCRFLYARFVATASCLLVDISSSLTCGHSGRFSALRNQQSAVNYSIFAF